MTASKTQIKLGARAIAESQGVDPDDLAPLGVMCAADNRHVTWEKVYEEQSETALTAALSDQAGGPTGTIRKMGWMPDDTGRVFFGAIVEYENGPPDLPIKIAWDKTPVRIVIVPPPSSTAGEG